jgi:uncharacterized protein YlxP (DUF503 family)
MGVEPTRDRSCGQATVLKTARPTGTLPPPRYRRGAVRIAQTRDIGVQLVGGRNHGRRPNVSSGKGDRTWGGWAATVQIGACVVTLHLPASRSLKEKRQVVRSLTERLRRQFNVAVAEVEEQDTWQTAVLGLAVVSNDAGHAQRQVDRIVEAIERSRLDAEVVDRQVDVMSL